MHTSCSARREMQVHTTARSLLGQLDGVTLHEQAYESECCGFGGTFSVRHPHISQAMVEDKTRHLLATGADTLVSADWGCLLNIKGSWPIRAGSACHAPGQLPARPQRDGGAA
jgi:L-lactate dehydrogenase complex protein LldE